MLCLHTSRFMIYSVEIALSEENNIHSSRKRFLLCFDSLLLIHKTLTHWRHAQNECLYNQWAVEHLLGPLAVCRLWPFVSRLLACFSLPYCVFYDKISPFFQPTVVITPSSSPLFACCFLSTTIPYRSSSTYLRSPPLTAPKGRLRRIFWS